MTSALRWGSEAPEGVDDAKARLLDAAQACFAVRGMKLSTVEDIARQAQVSRATVYRYFDGRDDIVSAVVLRTADRYLLRIRPHVDEFDSLAEVIVEWVVRTERAARRDPHLSMLFNVDEAATLGSAASTSVALFERVTEFFRPYFDTYSDEVRPGVGVVEASEWILRLLLSLLTVAGPRRRTQDGTRQFLRTYLVPSLLVSD